jgi:hypothetical protein
MSSTAAAVQPPLSICLSTALKTALKTIQHRVCMRLSQRVASRYRRHKSSIVSALKMNKRSYAYNMCAVSNRVKGNIITEEIDAFLKIHRTSLEASAVACFTKGSDVVDLPLRQWIQIAVDFYIHSLLNVIIAHTTLKCSKPLAPRHMNNAPPRALSRTGPQKSDASLSFPLIKQGDAKNPSGV